MNRCVRSSLLFSCNEYIPMFERIYADFLLCTVRIIILTHKFIYCFSGYRIYYSTPTWFFVFMQVCILIVIRVYISGFNLFNVSLIPRFYQWNRKSIVSNYTSFIYKYQKPTIIIQFLVIKKTHKTDSPNPNNNHFDIDLQSNLASLTEPQPISHKNARLANS